MRARIGRSWLDLASMVVLNTCTLHSIVEWSNRVGDMFNQPMSRFKAELESKSRRHASRLLTGLAWVRTTVAREVPPVEHQDKIYHDDAGGRRQKKTSICGEDGKRSWRRCRGRAPDHSDSLSIASRPPERRFGNAYVGRTRNCNSS